MISAPSLLLLAFSAILESTRAAPSALISQRADLIPLDINLMNGFPPLAGIQRSSVPADKSLLTQLSAGKAVTRVL